MDLRFQHPFAAVVAGPSSCGKSVFVKNLINNGLENMDIDFKDILWCYSCWRPSDSELNKTIVFQQGLENLLREDTSDPRLIIIDDLQEEGGNIVAELFTRGSHHNNISVIYITQNVFHQSKKSRDISLNSHYLVLFKNPRDSAQVNHLARQVFPSNPKFIQEAYKDATSRPHGYLLFDLKQKTPEHCRCRTNIFGEAEPNFTIVYTPKKKT